MSVSNDHIRSPPQPSNRGRSDEKQVFLPEERLVAQYGDSWQESVSKQLLIRNEYLRFFLAEFLGTFVLVAIGVGCVAQAVLNSSNLFRFNFVPICLGWGLAVACGVYISGGVSGGHINPALTICFGFFGRLKWRYVPVYLAGQYIGAFFGAAAVYLVYCDQLNFYDGGIRQGPYTPNATHPTAGIWATYPQHSHISTSQGFIDQIFATGLLVLMALAITDERNMQAHKGLVPLIIGLVVTALVTAFESNCGAALNPARDFSPRLFTAIAGWGFEVFSFRDYNWFWVPIMGPYIGAILGGWLYNICVGLHIPRINDYSPVEPSSPKRTKM